MKRSSSRITLMSFKHGKPYNSFNEGEYIFGGLQAALKDAHCAASNPNGFFGFGETHVGVCVFPVGEGFEPYRVVGPLIPIRQ